jgi:hemolysin III
MKKEKPILRGHFHQASFFIALGACILLIAKGDSQLETLSVLVYTFGILFLFGISALYHRITWQPKERAFMRKLDHSAIYIMIAATSTPIGLLSLVEPSSSKFVISIWLVAFFGVIQSIFFVNLPKYISAILYVIAGYMVAPYFSELSNNIGAQNIILLISGGVAYTIGAICYALKRPILNPKIFGYHEVFHVLVSLGAIFHFILIYSIV